MCGGRSPTAKQINTWFKREATLLCYLVSLNRQIQRDCKILHDLCLHLKHHFVKKHTKTEDTHIAVRLVSTLQFSLCCCQGHSLLNYCPSLASVRHAVALATALYCSTVQSSNAVVGRANLSLLRNTGAKLSIFRPGTSNENGEYIHWGIIEKKHFASYLLEYLKVLLAGSQLMLLHHMWWSMWHWAELSMSMLDGRRSWLN